MVKRSHHPWSHHLLMLESTRFFSSSNHAPACGLYKAPGYFRSDPVVRDSMTFESVAYTEGVNIFCTAKATVINSYHHLGVLAENLTLRYLLLDLHRSQM